MKKDSELGRLIDKNLDYPGGLNDGEFQRALYLIDNPQYSGKNCWACETNEERNGDKQYNQSIYDTDLCERHARHALSFRKDSIFNEFDS